MAINFGQMKGLAYRHNWDTAIARDDKNFDDMIQAKKDIYADKEQKRKEDEAFRLQQYEKIERGDVNMPWFTNDYEGLVNGQIKTISDLLKDPQNIKDDPEKMYQISTATNFIKNAPHVKESKRFTQRKAELLQLLDANPALREHQYYVDKLKEAENYEMTGTLDGKSTAANIDQALQNRWDWQRIDDRQFSDFVTNLAKQTAKGIKFTPDNKLGGIRKDQYITNIKDIAQSGYKDGKLLIDAAYNDYVKGWKDEKNQPKSKDEFLEDAIASRVSLDSDLTLFPRTYGGGHGNNENNKMTNYRKWLLNYAVGVTKGQNSQSIKGVTGTFIGNKSPDGNSIKFKDGESYLVKDKNDNWIKVTSGVKGGNINSGSNFTKLNIIPGIKNYSVNNTYKINKNTEEVKQTLTEKANAAGVDVNTFIKSTSGVKALDELGVSVFDYDGGSYINIPVEDNVYGSNSIGVKVNLLDQNINAEYNKLYPSQDDELPLEAEFGNVRAKELPKSGW
jgi:hypothetical protein